MSFIADCMVASALTTSKIEGLRVVLERKKKDEYMKGDDEVDVGRQMIKAMSWCRLYTRRIKLRPGRIN